VLKRAGGGSVTAPAIDVSIASTAATFTEVHVGTTSQRKLEVDGATGGTGGAVFVVSKNPTHTATGDTTLHFKITGHLVSGEELIFVVDAVVELDPTTIAGGAWSNALISTPGTKLVIPSAIPAFPLDDGHDALTQWSFPDGGETAAAPKYQHP
jgi:hypothetical protein